METGAVYRLPVQGRHFVVDERGVGMRATWHLDRGFVNLSLWRNESCVETFHLTPSEAGRLVGFLANGLGEAVQATASHPPVVGLASEDPAPGKVAALPAHREFSRALGRLLVRGVTGVAALCRPFRQMLTATFWAAQARADLVAERDRHDLRLSEVRDQLAQSLARQPPAPTSAIAKPARPRSGRQGRRGRSGEGGWMTTDQGDLDDEG